MGDTGSLALGGADRRPGDRHPHRAAAGRARRAVRRRDAVGRHPGRVLPGHPAAGVPHGAAAPPLRAGRAGRRTPSSCGSGWSPGMAVAFGLGLFYADWLALRGAAEPSTVPARRAHRRSSPGSGVSGAAAARVLLDRGARVLLDRRRASPAARRPSSSAAGADLARRAATPSPAASSWSSPRPAGAPTPRCWPTPPAAGVPVVGEPELAWELRPGADDGVARRGWRSPAPTARPRPSPCSRRCCSPPGGGPSPRATSAGRWSRWSPPATTTAPAYDVLAVELSSFQLHWSTTLAPAAAAVLNVADDHTDWHGSFAAYRDAKARILAHAPVAVADAGDPVAAAAGRRPPAPGHRHPRRARRRGSSASGTARWSTAPSPTIPPGEVLLDAAALPVPGPAQHRQRPGRRRARPRGRRPRRGGRPRAVGLPPAAPHRNVAGRRRSTASTGSTTARPPTRTRRARRWPPTRGWSGSPAGCSRAPTSTRWSPRWPRGWPGWSCWAATGPDRGRTGATRPDSPSRHGAQRRR